MATEMAEVSNRVNFGSWLGRLTCPEKSRQREYSMISGLVRKKRYGIQCPENIGPASTWWHGTSVIFWVFLKGTTAREQPLPLIVTKMMGFETDGLDRNGNNSNYHEQISGNTANTESWPMMTCQNAVLLFRNEIVYIH